LAEEEAAMRYVLSEEEEAKVRPCCPVCNHVLLTGCSLLNKADSILHSSGDPEEKLVVAFNMQFVTRQKMETLRDGVWLSDEVINFYAAVLQQRNDEAQPRAPACKIFNTFLYTKVCDSRICVVYRTQRHWSSCPS
jgi:Ulp1 family protease